MFLNHILRFCTENNQVVQKKSDICQENCFLQGTGWTIDYMISTELKGVRSVPKLSARKMTFSSA